MNAADKTPELSRNTKLPAILTRHGTVWTVGLIIIAIFINSLVKGGFGLIGGDSDDIIRLVQIKDYLAGQSWFHTDQYRMGLAGGTDMHWSRIPDIPIIILTHFFDLFMPQDRALVWAFTIWPPLSVGLLIWGLLVGAKHWAMDKRRGDKTKVFTLVLSAVYLFSFYRFAPGAIDHHNLQLGFLAISLGFALDPKLRFWSYFISGCALAMSVAIGVEIYIFAAVICGFVALNWAFIGRAASAATQGFGAGFSLTLALAFLGTVKPSEYGLIYCDALSLITITAGICGALGLAALARLEKNFAIEQSVTRRFMGLLVLGVICAGALFVQAPQCLVNPLDSLPDEVVSLWLDNISEAVPITHAIVDKTKTLPFMICAPLTACIILVFDIRRIVSNRSSAKDQAGIAQKMSLRLLPLALLIAAIALTIYQVRFYPFAYIFALIPLAAWVGRIYVESKIKNPASVIYLAALVASVPLAWAVPGVLIENPEKAKEEKEKDEKIAKCASDDVIKNLIALPTGTIVADPNMAGVILEKTDHRTVSGNYHRNWKGISTQIQIAVSEPEHSGKLLFENNIDYLFYCKTGAETDYYSRHNEEGLTAKISEGDIPDYLERLSPPELEDGDVLIFKVKRLDS